MEARDWSARRESRQLSVKIESPSGEQALTEFVLFQHRVYEYRAARWAAMVAVQLPILMGEGPFADGRKIKPFTARVDGNLVARAVSIIDSHYQRHWNEPLGHIVMFEAMPGTRDGGARGIWIARVSLRHRRLRNPAAGHRAPESRVLSRAAERRGIRNRAW